jgi:ubiquitin-conjugating enzyme E2 variant
MATQQGDIILPRAIKLRLEFNAASGKKGATYLLEEHQQFINYLIHDMTAEQKEDASFDCVGYWQGIIIGIQNERCGEVIYRFVVKIPQNYPIAPPIVRFITKIALPCIDNKGIINIERIPNYTWSPLHNIADVLMAIREAMKDKTYIAQSAQLISHKDFFNESSTNPEANFQ